MRRRIIITRALREHKLVKAEMSAKSDMGFESGFLE